MTLDETTEILLNNYGGMKNIRRAFLRKPSSDNFEVREAIQDPNGQPMYTQPAGLVYEQHEWNMDGLLGILDSGVDRNGNRVTAPMNEDKYKEVVDKYSLSDEGKLEFYVQLAREGMFSKEASNETKAVSGLARLAYQIEDLVAKEEYDQVARTMAETAGKDKDAVKIAKLAYQYQAMGQHMNLANLAMQYAGVQLGIARKLVDDKVKGEIESVVAENNKNRAKAAVNLYSVYNSSDEYKAPKEDNKA